MGKPIDTVSKSQILRAQVKVLRVDSGFGGTKRKILSTEDYLNWNLTPTRLAQEEKICISLPLELGLHFCLMF